MWRVKPVALMIGVCVCCVAGFVTIDAECVARTLHHRLRRREAAPLEEAPPAERKLRSAEAAAPRLTDARTVEEEEDAARTPTRDAGAAVAAAPVMAQAAILEVVEWMPIGRAWTAVVVVNSATEATALANARLNAVVIEPIDGCWRC